MLDFDAGKLLIIGVVALIVIGPKDLPRVLRQVGQAVARIKRMAGEFQGQFMDAMREADLEAIRDELKKTTADAELAARFDPARDIQRELTASVSSDAMALPASSPPLAALEPSVPSVADGFALPTIEPSVETVASAADAGAVPIADLEPIADPTDGPAATAEPPARKRRIRVRRRVTNGRRAHVVLDRTGLSRPAAGRSFAGEARP